MPSRLERADFIAKLQGRSIDLTAADADPQLRSVLPFKADLDADGVIAGAGELDALFTQIDSFGREPTATGTDLVGPDGRGTQAAAALAALGRLTQEPAVVAWTRGIDLQSRIDWSQYRAPAGAWASGDAMLGASAMLLRDHRNHYGVKQPWFNIDPNHALPAGRPLGGLGATTARPQGVWKCNLFGGNALYAAGFEPPYYGNAGRGEYPNANQFYKFSDRYAATFRNKIHFKLISEVRLQDVDTAVSRPQLIEVLRQAQPGDLIMVDHRGDGVSDGGHTRVVLSNGLSADGTGALESAQATFNDATVRSERLSSFTGEEHVWVLRPNRPRAQGSTTVTPASVTPTPAPAPTPPAPSPARNPVSSWLEWLTNRPW